MANDRLEIATAGFHMEDILYFSPGVHICGRIVDGVALEHGNSGGWVISFSDLELMYMAARKARKIKA